MRAIIVANGEFVKPEPYPWELEQIDIIIAADGGIQHCRSLGLIPSIVIGDLDSTNFEEQQEKVNNDLTTVTSGLVSNLELGSVNHNSDRLTISGIASDETLILGYAKKLRASERFSQVIISNIEKTGEGMSFELALFK